MSIVGELNRLQEMLHMEKKSFDGAHKWVNSEDFDMPRELVNKLTFEFKFHKICFNHNDVDYPYIETTLRINYQNNEVGYYSIFCDFEGEIIDDMLVISDENLKNA